MNCQKYKKLLDKYFNQDINEEEREELFSHISDCNECSEEFESLDLISNELNNIEDIPLPENFADEIMLEIEKHESEKKEDNKGGFYKFNSLSYYIAIAILLIFSLNALNLEFNQNNIEEVGMLESYKIETSNENLDKVNDNNDLENEDFMPASRAMFKEDVKEDNNLEEETQDIYYEDSKDEVGFFFKVYELIKNIKIEIVIILILLTIVLIEILRYNKR